MIHTITAKTTGSRRVLVLGLVLAALMAAGLLLVPKPVLADATFTVTGTDDSEDPDPGDDECGFFAGRGGRVCTLRAAIQQANATPGADTIKFNIPGSGVKTISPTQQLPRITDPVTIDGYSQPGSRPNSRTIGALDAVILIELDGFNAGTFANGLQIEASNVLVRGLAIDRFFDGSGILINSGMGSKIEGNFIGMDTSGTLDLGNSFGGVRIEGGSMHTIGGITPDKRNLISGNNGDGIVLGGKGGNKVQGNLMGVQKDGRTIVGGSDVGVRISTPKNTIGGTEPEAANTIAHNFQDGVRISEDDSTVGNRILSNSIFSNGALGIDLRGDGRTLNDPKDPDKGENTLQNFPVLTSASSVGDGKITIKGTLDSTPSTKKKKKTFTIQFYSSPQGEEDEGKTYLDQTKVTTNKQGQASFSFETTKPVPDRDEITATATGSGGNTSEFSDPETFIID